MAITIPIVTEFKDAGLQRAETNLQGFAGKAKGLLASVGISGTQAAGALALSIGVKAVNAFQDLALEAGRMADATGLAVEDASRLIEVTGDLGIEAGTVQGALQRMNKVIGEGGAAFEQFGVEIFRTDDGLVDANKTFQSAITTIGAIEDPTLRAKAAQEVFGRSYGDMAELMEMSALDLATALGQVSDAKVIDQKELDRARKFREQLDNLNGIVEDAAISLGEQLVPILGEMSDAVIVLDNALSAMSGNAGGGIAGLLRAAYDTTGLSQLVQFINDLGDYAGLSGDEVDELAVSIENNTVASFQMEQMYRDRIPGAIGATKTATEGLTTEIGNLQTAYDILTDNISDRKAWKDFELTMFYFRNTVGMSQEQSDEFALALADIIVELDDMPEETRIDLLTQLDRSDFEYVDMMLRQFRLGAAIPIRTKLFEADKFRLPQRATGGPALANRPYIVGERGPELFVPTGSGRVIPNDQMGGAGMTVNISTSADPNDVIQAIEYYRRRNGTALV